MAIASLVLGAVANIVGFLNFFNILSVGAIVLGTMTYSKAKTENTCIAFPLAGILLGFASLMSSSGSSLLGGLF